MALKIQDIPNQTASAFVDQGSRYIKSTPIYYDYGNRNILTFKTYKRNTIPPTSQDKFTVIRPGDEYRPDLLSYRFYGTPDFWYKIMEANGIFDIFDFKAGLNIRLPSQPYGA